MPFDKTRLARLDAWMNRYVEQGKFPGSTLLLAQDGEIVHRASAGLRAVESGLPYQDDTIVRIYSMTKPIASVALMTLVEKGLFHLDAPISEFIPEFKDMEALIPGAERLDQTAPCATPTVVQTATHTSGLSYSFNPTILGPVYRERKLDFPPNGHGLAATARMVAELPLAFQPGTQWHYSNGIDILGRIIEVVSGKPLDAFIREEITGPLGMEDTFFTLPDDRVDRFASLYTCLDPENMMGLGAHGEGVINLVEDAEGSVFRGATTFSGGGGLLSTAGDYFAFAEMLRKGGAHGGARILSRSTTGYIRRNFLPGDIASMGPKSFAEMPMDGVGFGIGGSVVLDPARMRMPGNVGDFSWGGMASTIFWTDPVEEITCVFLTQLTPSSAYPNRAELKALVHGALD